MERTLFWRQVWISSFFAGSAPIDSDVGSLGRRLVHWAVNSTSLAPLGDENSRDGLSRGGLCSLWRYDRVDRRREKRDREMKKKRGEPGSRY